MAVQLTGIDRQAASKGEQPVPDAWRSKRYMVSVNAQLREAAPAEKAVDDDSDAGRRLTAVVNTDDVDRYRSIIDPRGAEVDDFLANPVVLWQHGYDSTFGLGPVGSVLKLNMSDKAIEAVIQFMDTDFGKEVARMYREGTMRAFSIGFIPKSYVWEELDGVEIVRFTRWELVEISCVSVPGNAKALAKALNDGSKTLRNATLEASLRTNLALGDDGAATTDYLARSLHVPEGQLALDLPGFRAATGKPPKAPAPAPAGQQQASAPATPASPPGGQPAPAGTATPQQRDQTPPAKAPEAAAGAKATATAAGTNGATMTAGAGQSGAGAGHQPLPGAAPATRTINLELPADVADRVQAALADPGNRATYLRELGTGLLTQAQRLDQPRVDWEGNFDIGAECRAAPNDAVVTAMAALTCVNGPKSVRHFVHHRTDGTLSWPALASCMAQLCTQPMDLTRLERDQAYQHLAEHYRVIGVEPPEPGAKTPGEAYDLALCGRMAMIDGDNAWLYARKEPGEGTTEQLPVFKCVSTGTERTYNRPHVGRLTDERFWGSRSLPDMRGTEALLTRLAESQERLVDLTESRKGAEFSKKNKTRIAGVSDSLGQAATALADVGKTLTGVAGELRAMVTADTGDEGDDDEGEDDGRAARAEAIQNGQHARPATPAVATPPAAPAVTTEDVQRAAAAGLQELVAAAMTTTLENLKAGRSVRGKQNLSDLRSTSVTEV